MQKHASNWKACFSQETIDQGRSRKQKSGLKESNVICLNHGIGSKAGMDAGINKISTVALT
jgi:hypothetical protein